jgi:hypothetical protein
VSKVNYTFWLYFVKIKELREIGEIKEMEGNSP